MWQLIYYSLFLILIFFASLIWYKKCLSISLYALAIGGVVGSLYYGSSKPIDIFGLNFNLASIIFTLYLFSLMMMFICFSRYNALSLMISSLIAMLLSIIIDSTAVFLSNGVSVEFWKEIHRLVTMFTSTLISSLVMIYFVNFLKKRFNINDYLSLIIGMLIGSITFTTLDIPLQHIVSDYQFNTLLPHYITVVSSIFISTLVLFTKKLIDKKTK
jgi:hypothetical protein